MKCGHEALTLLVDLFAGGGGTSTGAIRVLTQDMGLVVGVTARVIAINHDAKSIQTHKLNHPEAEHWEDDVEKLDPRDVLRCPSCLEIVQITELVGSPPCQEYSIAAGGKPKNRQRRATVFYLLKWVRWGRPRRGTFENVPEFQKTREFARLIRGIKALRRIGLNYRVEPKVLDSADYGGAQRRKRLFIKIALDDAPISWPTQTHSKAGKVPGTSPWVGAIKVLNLEEPTRSVFGRVRPLSVKTRARIARGIRARGRFWEPLAQSVEQDAGRVPLRTLVDACPREEWPSALRVSFTLGQQGGAEARPIDEPFATVSTAGYIRLAEAFLLPVDGPGGNGANNPPRDLTLPLASIRAERGGGHVIDPILMHVTHGGRLHDTALPLPTVTGANRGELALADARIILQSGGPEWSGERPRDAAEPLPTVLTRDHLAVADSRLIVSLDRPETNRSLAKDTSEPLPTIVANNERVGVIEPFLIAHHGERAGQAPRYHDASAPLPTVPASRAHDVVFLRLIQTYNGNGQVRDASEPLGTETTVERHSLIEVRLDELVYDVGMRMLTVRELARGQGFPDTYQFQGTKRDQVRQVGNAVHVDIAYHLIRADFTGLGIRETRLSDFPGAVA